MLTCSSRALNTLPRNGCRTVRQARPTRILNLTASHLINFSNSRHSLKHRQVMAHQLLISHRSNILTGLHLNSRLLLIPISRLRNFTTDRHAHSEPALHRCHFSSKASSNLHGLKPLRKAFRVLQLVYHPLLVYP